MFKGKHSQYAKIQYNSDKQVNIAFIPQALMISHTQTMHFQKQFKNRPIHRATNNSDICHVFRSQRLLKK